MCDMCFSYISHVKPKISHVFISSVGCTDEPTLTRVTGTESCHCSFALLLIISIVFMNHNITELFVSFYGTMATTVRLII